MWWWFGLLYAVVGLVTGFVFTRMEYAYTHRQDKQYNLANNAWQNTLIAIPLWPLLVLVGVGYGIHKLASIILAPALTYLLTPSIVRKSQKALK